jgi:hypothetical protein
VTSQSLDTIVDSGIDYITAVYKGPRSDSDLASFGRFIVGEQRQLGEKESNFHFSGYRGLSCGSASFGVRWDSQIVRLSSSCAKEHWNQAYNLASNVTRLDLQITVLPPEGPQARLAKHHREMLRAKRGRGRARKFKFWYGPNGPESAIFNSRKSDIFNRAYDKGLESGYEEFAGTLRYESELKRLAAMQTAFELDQAGDERLVIASKVGIFLAKSEKAFAKYFSPGLPLERSAKALQVRKPITCPVVSQQEFAELSSVYKGAIRNRRFAAFLRMSVQPGVHRLLDHVGSEAVLESLGLCIVDGKLQKAHNQLWDDFKKWR